jgi:amino acid transporter
MAVTTKSRSNITGIGLFLQNGRAIHYAGPGLATLAYFLSGTVIWSSAACLGEMTALFPVKGPIFELPKRFLDQSVGYATGWITWCLSCLNSSVELIDTAGLGGSS